MGMLGLFARRYSTDPSQHPVRQPCCGTRFLLPFGTSALRALLAGIEAGPTREPFGRLWTISDDGACVSVPGGCVIPPCASPSPTP